MNTSKKEFIQQIANKLLVEKKDAEKYLDVILDTLYENFKNGNGVTFTGFGNFYLDNRKDSTVFKFNPSQKLKKLFGWSSTYKGPL